MAKQEENKPISLDMTKAATMEPMAANTLVLCQVSKMDSGISGSGGKKIDVELTVVKPDTVGIINRKLFDSINLENEFTLGRLLNLLKALGESEEEIRRPDFELVTENYIGKQLAVWVGIRESEQFGDRNTIKRVRPASAYTED